jgi:Zn-dependent M28 family amino/carboxypeptidase
VAAQLRRGTLTVQSADSTPIPALFVLGPRMSRTLVRPGAAPARGATLGTIRGDVRLRGEPAPGYNVVARLPGADPALRGQMVAFGAHLDHVGLSATPVDHDSLRAFNGVVRPGGAEDGEKQATDADWPRVRAALDSLRRTRPARRDSVRNGADDDGSGSIGLLAIADAFAASRPRPRRSLLFVWHTGEELGMVGSRWFTDHPTVPLDSVVAQLNVDMIGRGAATDLPNGGPGYVQLIGSRRLSTELGDLVERVNRDARHGFAFDYQFDANGHPAQYYCRSDHYMYARFGIPITFFSTGGHRDYHQLTDEVQYIDFDKLSRVSRLIHDVGAAVANLDRRPSVDKPKPDPNGECTQ